MRTTLRRLLLALLALPLAVLAAAPAAAHAPRLAGYLFVYFGGDGTEDGEQVRFALSRGNDPLHWQALNGGRPVLVSTVGEKGVRDPHIVRAPGGDRFYLIATDLRMAGRDGGQWWEVQRHGSRSIVVWESTDLVHWSAPRLAKVAPDEAGNAWAPEAVWDARLGKFVVFWASRLYAPEDKGRLGVTYNKMLYATTDDFRSFSAPQVWSDPGYSVIDATVIEHAGRYYRYSKDDREPPQATRCSESITAQKSASLTSPTYEFIADCIGRGVIGDGEGPLVFKSNTEQKWYLFIDEYGGQGYVPFETTDLDAGRWTKSKDYQLPPSPRHGAVIPVTQDEYDRLLAAYPQAAAGPSIRIDAARIQARISPTLHGLMTEEINFSYEGGLYGELIRNRSFKAEAGYAYQADEPVYWSAVGDARIALDKKVKLNDALDLSLLLEVKGASDGRPAGISNAGYWGIPVLPDTTYTVSFYAKAEGDDPGPVTAALADKGGAVLASATVSGITGEWKKFELKLTTGKLEASKDNVFTLTTTRPGRLWLQQVSVFGPTYKNRPNGNRPDLMEMLAALKPKFLRFPGGNYLQGDTFNQRFQWKQAIGDVARRPGHRSPWNYWSTDGMGLMEFLLWCEELDMEPVLGVFAGLTLQRDKLSSPDDLEPYVQEALDEIEYIVGDTGTKWGAQRAKDGHPAPFRLRYVEVGNEDFFDASGSYDKRFAIFYRAIKAKYPQLQIISTVAREATPSQRPDLVDEHTYAWGEAQMYEHLDDYDERARSDPQVFVGEWATHQGWPMPNMKAAIADAAYLASLERNADHVVMAAYAPLLTNLSHVGGPSRDNSLQWSTNLIGYDALKAFGTPSYYVQKMFAEARGDVVLPSSGSGIPTWSTAQGKSFPALHWVATRTEKTGRIQLKLASRAATPQEVRLSISGVNRVSPEATLTVLSSADPDAGNSLEEPQRIVPVKRSLRGVAREFTLTVPAYSVSVLEIDAK